MKGLIGLAGRGAFDGEPVPAATLAVPYSNYTHLVTLARSGIASVADLRGGGSRSPWCRCRASPAPLHPGAARFYAR